MNALERPAGPVGEFLSLFQHSQWSEDGIVTPCGDCHSCCTTLSVIVEADELEAVAAMDSEHLIEHHSRDAKYWTIAKDEFGKCPNLVEGKCAIWSVRPRMCKKFDCRLYAVANLELKEIPVSLSERIASWKFSFDHEADDVQYQAFLRALKFLNDYKEIFGARGIESGSIEAASLAVDLRCLFEDSTPATDDAQLLAQVLTSIRTMQQRLHKPSKN